MKFWLDRVVLLLIVLIVLIYEVRSQLNIINTAENINSLVQEDLKPAINIENEYIYHTIVIAFIVYSIYDFIVTLNI